MVRSTSLAWTHPAKTNKVHRAMTAIMRMNAPTELMPKLISLIGGLAVMQVTVGSLMGGVGLIR